MMSEGLVKILEETLNRAAKPKGYFGFIQSMRLNSDNPRILPDMVILESPENYKYPTSRTGEISSDEISEK